MVDDVERGRAAYRRNAWDEAYSLLSCADESASLDPADLEMLGECAHLMGRSDASVDARSRVYTSCVRRGANGDAAMCAIRIHTVLILRGDVSPAMGWLARAQRLLAQEPECVARGYLYLAEAAGNYYGGNLDGSLELARRAAKIGHQFTDLDLVNLGLFQEGRTLAALGDISRTTVLLDEAMVAVVSGEVANPYNRTWIYCGSIEVCGEIGDLRRASAWTSAFERWLTTLSGATPISGSCRMHRSRILRLREAWTEAEREARHACEEQNGTVAFDTGQAWYQVGEIRRLVGDLAAAEEAFGHAGRYGWEVQPGMAFLRAAQGRADAAAAGLARALAEWPSDCLARAKLLPAQAELAIASRNLKLARTAVTELVAIADIGPLVRAAAAFATGALRLAERNPAGALPELRAAAQIWGELDVPYEVARSRRLIGLACREIGDEDAARIEWDTCRAIFSRLGAVPALKDTDGLLGRPTPAHRPDGLSAREIEVLRLVADGMTNQSVAASLSLSEKTVSRHISNIFAKIGVSSRAAATAYAYREGLV